MRRRDFICAIYCAAIALPHGTAAQQPGKVWRIGHVLPTTPELGQPYAQALEQRLADFGYVLGRNIVLLHRFTGGPQLEKINEVIISLVPQIDILAVWGIAIYAAKKSAAGVPTVFISAGYPVEEGLVQSLAHPGGNMTGIIAEAATETNGKRLQILKEVVPGLKRVAVLRAAYEPTVVWMTSLDLAARQLGVTLFPVEFTSAGDLETAFAGVKKSETEALIVLGGAVVIAFGKEIADLAIRVGLPSCYYVKDGVMAGGLVSYGPDRLAMARPAAALIDKIIKGASPADIPCEQPTVYELYINSNTARLLNLTIPPLLLAQADEVIE
jgi:putative tryptophan/tyrosine transport system substrate-binding protein